MVARCGDLRGPGAIFLRLLDSLSSQVGDESASVSSALRHSGIAGLINLVEVESVLRSSLRGDGGQFGGQIGGEQNVVGMVVGWFLETDDRIKPRRCEPAIYKA